MTWVKLFLAILVSSESTVSGSDNGNGGRGVWSIGRMVFWQRKTNSTDPAPPHPPQVLYGIDSSPVF